MGLEFRWRWGFYFKLNKSGKLIGMIFSHVDDFNLVGTDNLIKDITKKTETALNVSKVEDINFWFTRIGIKKINNRDRNINEGLY